MKRISLIRDENAVTEPDAERLRLIEEEDKKPESCSKTFNFDACKIRHTIAKRDYKAAIATGAKRPKKNPCYYCQLITDKLLENAKKAKGENAIEYEEEAEKVPTKVVTQKVTKELDHESNGLVQKSKPKQSKEEKPKVVEPGTRICKGCGKPFTPRSPQAKYCSQKCSHKLCNQRYLQKLRKGAEPREETPKVCPTCGKTFLTSVTKKIFCSDRCRYAYRYKKKAPGEAEVIASPIAETVKTESVKEEEPKQPLYYTSPRHALEMTVNSLQKFMDVVDYMTRSSKSGKKQVLIYLSDDMFETSKRIKSYLGCLEETNS